MDVRKITKKSTFSYVTLNSEGRIVVGDLAGHAVGFSVAKAVGLAIGGTEGLAA